MTGPLKPEDPMVPAMLEYFPEHAQYIAYIIAEWSHIEHRLILLLASLSGSGTGIVHPMLYAIVSSSSRLDAITAAFRRLIPDNERADVDDILHLARGRLTLRDRYAHALFGWFDPHGPTGNDKRLSIVSQTDKRPSEELPLHQLKEEFRRSKLLNHRISTLLINRFLTATPPSGSPEAGSPPSHQPDSPLGHTDGPAQPEPTTPLTE